MFVNHVCDLSSSKNRLVSLGFLVFQQDLTLDICVKMLESCRGFGSNILVGELMPKNLSKASQQRDDENQNKFRV